MPRVLIVGASKIQAAALTRRIPEEIDIRAIEPCKALRLKSYHGDLVICTRFLGHKHQRHLERIACAPVEFCAGGIESWARFILGWGFQHYPRLAARACG